MRVQSVFRSLYLTLATLQSMYFIARRGNGQFWHISSASNIIGMPAMGFEFEFEFDSIECNWMQCNEINSEL